LPSLAWSHRKSPLHQPEREESRLAIRGNPQNRICKKIALQRPKTGKFDYLSEPNHPAHSMAFKFFTDDELIDAAIDHGRPLELSPVGGVIYRAFVDAAGGGPDSYTISIGHKEGDVYIIDVVRGTSGKFDPQSVTEEYAKLCRQYRIRSV